MQPSHHHIIVAHPRDADLREQQIQIPAPGGDVEQHQTAAGRSPIHDIDHALAQHAQIVHRQHHRLVPVQLLRRRGARLLADIGDLRLVQHILHQVPAGPAVGVVLPQKKADRLLLGRLRGRRGQRLRRQQLQLTGALRPIGHAFLHQIQHDRQQHEQHDHDLHPLEIEPLPLRAAGGVFSLHTVTSAISASFGLPAFQSTSPPQNSTSDRPLGERYTFFSRIRSKARSMPSRSFTWA